MTLADEAELICSTKARVAPTTVAGDHYLVWIYIELGGVLVNIQEGIHEITCSARDLVLRAATILDIEHYALELVCPSNHKFILVFRCQRNGSTAVSPDKRRAIL